MSEEIKQKIVNVMETYGTKIQFMANRAGMSRETLSRFLHNKQELGQESLLKLEKMLERM